MRVIKLPELLIEVDNELKFTRHFMSEKQKANFGSDDICAVLTTIMAHGCNIGPYTMAQLVSGVSYRRIKNITDWMLNEETQTCSFGFGCECHKPVGYHAILGRRQYFKQRWPTVDYETESAAADLEPKIQ